MTKSMVLLLSGIVLAGCAREEGYTINGTLAGDAEGARVSLMEEQPQGPVKIDSAVVADGRFVLKGKVDAPGLYSIIIDTNAPDAEQPDYRNKMFRTQFYLENSDITYEGDIATLPSYYYNPERTGKPVIKGSAPQSLWDEYRQSIKAVTDELSALDRQYTQEYLIPELDGNDATERGIEIVKREKVLGEQKKSALWDFIRKNSGSVVAFDEASYIINGYSAAPTSAEIDSLMDILGKDWEGTARYEALKSDATVARRLAIGEPYIDMMLLDAKGDTVALSDIVPEGKHVMLEFWASWCGPCRAEIPHLAKVHKKYPDFEIISISVDADDADWKKAMEEEGMVWTQLRSLNGMEGDIKDKYNIFGVPTCLVLDESGNFYKSNMRGAYLDEFLSETY